MPMFLQLVTSKNVHSFTYMKSTIIPIPNPCPSSPIGKVEKKTFETEKYQLLLLIYFLNNAIIREI